MIIPDGVILANDYATKCDDGKSDEFQNLDVLSMVISGLHILIMKPDFLSSETSVILLSLLLKISLCESFLRNFVLSWQDTDVCTKVLISVRQSLMIGWFDGVEMASSEVLIEYLGGSISSEYKGTSVTGTEEVSGLKSFSLIVLVLLQLKWLDYFRSCFKFKPRNLLSLYRTFFNF